MADYTLTTKRKLLKFNYLQMAVAITTTLDQSKGELTQTKINIILIAQRRLLESNREIFKALTLIRSNLMPLTGLSYSTCYQNVIQLRELGYFKAPTNKEGTEVLYLGLTVKAKALIMKLERLAVKVRL